MWAEDGRKYLAGYFSTFARYAIETPQKFHVPQSTKSIKQEFCVRM